MVFVDRDEEISWLLSLYESRKKGSRYNVILYGMRRVGKTALMEEFMRCVEHGIVLRLAHVTSGIELAYDLVSALEDLAVRMGMHLPEFSLPNSTFAALRFLIEYSQTFARENNIILVVCLDEFHLMLEHLAMRIAVEEKLRLDDALQKVFWYLKDSMPVTENVFWVLSTSLSWHMLERHTKTDPARKAFLALFTTKKIDPLTKESSLGLICSLSETLNYDIPNDVAERIYEVTGGIPALIEIIISHVAPQKVENISMLEEVLYRIGRSTELNDFFEAIMSFVDEVSRYGRTVILRVMRGLAKGNTTPKELTKSESMDYNVVYNVLEELTDMGFVKKQKLGKEAMYFLKYPLMKTWLLSTKPYVSRSDEQKIRTSLGIMFDKYIEGLFHQAKTLSKPLIIREKNGVFFNNTIEQLEILPIYRAYVPRGPPHKQIDLVAMGRMGKKEIYYLIENKYTMAPIPPSEIIKFSERVKSFIIEENIRNNIAIIIQGGEGGYNPASVAIAIKNNIVTITKIGLIQIARLLNYPKII